MKKIYFSYFFLTIIFLLITTITIKFDSKLSVKNNINHEKCSELNYQKSINLHPNKFKSIKLNLRIPDYREWSQLLLEEEIQAKASQLKFKSNYKVYSNRKRVDAIFEVEINSELKCSLLARIRPHGDLEDHRSTNSLPSLNVNITDGHLFGIVKFILFKPNTRNYDNEILASTLLKEINFLAPRTANFNVTHNQKTYKFIFQEKIEKEFIENNLKVENPIFKGDERFTFIDKQKFQQEKTIFNHIFKPINKNFISKDDNQKFATEIGLSILNEIVLYYQGDVDEDDNFDFYSAGKRAGYKNNFDNFKTLDAILLSMDGDHALPPGNRRVYFDTIFKNFYPIYYDGMVRLLDQNNNYIKKPIIKGSELIFKSESNKLYGPGMFRGKAIISAVEGAENALELITKIDKEKFKRKLLSNGVLIEDRELNKILDGIVQNLQTLKNFKKDKVFQFKKIITPSIYIKNDFDYISELEKIPYKENLKRRLVYYGNTKESFISCDILNKNCENLLLKKEDVATLISQSYEDSKGNKLIFLGKTKNKMVSEGWLGREHFLKLKNLNFHNDVLDFKIKKIGNIDLKIDENTKTILINKTNENGRIVFHNGILKNWKINFNDKVRNSRIKNRRDINGLTGCITFVDLIVENISLETNNSTCEDAVNFIRSNGNNISINSNNSKADSLDADFSQLKFNSVIINNSKNDCLDFSYGIYEVKNIKLNNCGDKGVSAGENSNLYIENISANNTNIGIAAKDFSKVKIDKSEINNSKICYESYNKKQEFSGAYLLIKNSNCKNSYKESYKDNNSIIEYGQI